MGENSHLSEICMRTAISFYIFFFIFLVKDKCFNDFSVTPILPSCLCLPLTILNLSDINIKMSPAEKELRALLVLPAP